MDQYQCSVDFLVTRKWLQPLKKRWLGGVNEIFWKREWTFQRVKDKRVKEIMEATLIHDDRKEWSLMNSGWYKLAMYEVMATGLFFLLVWDVPLLIQAASSVHTS